MVKKLTKPNVSHYVNADEIEAIDLIVALGYGSAHCASNIIKYIARFPRKGEPMKDLLKAKQYLDWLIELETNDNQ